MSKRGQAIGSKGSIVIYKAKGGKTALEVKLEKDTVWLTQKQMAELFDIERSVITKHLKNIFYSKELDENSVCANFAHTAADGKFTKPIITILTRLFRLATELIHQELLNSAFGRRRC